MAHLDRRTFMLSTSFGVLAARSAFAQADQVVFGAVLPWAAWADLGVLARKSSLV